MTANDVPYRPEASSPPGELPNAALDAPDAVQDALDCAYRYLAHRDRTEHEMRTQLEREGVGAAAIEEAVGVLTELQYLDDARFALRFTQDKRELEAWGGERIERRLTALGVERDLVRAALAEDSESRAELDRALALLRRRFAEPPGDCRGRDRALGVLLRKGYEPDLALEALASWSRS
ncbi:MAG: RecX family transcriptional regulator [Actinomycetota bacterium]|nr:RecX family transcriptional regulator [Actinomycetota bacterium]